MEAGSDQLRRAIGSKYTDATANYDHRDLNRRYYYQALAERILPQCRRILLDSQKRKLYDEQCRLHRANDPRALSYVAFRAALKNPEALRDGIAPENLPSLENDAELSPPLQEEVK